MNKATENIGEMYETYMKLRDKERMPEVVILPAKRKEPSMSGERKTSN